MKKYGTSSNVSRATVTHDFVHINSKNCKACQLNVVTKQKHKWTQIRQETTTEQTVTLLRYSVIEFNIFLIPRFFPISVTKKGKI